MAERLPEVEAPLVNVDAHIERHQGSSSVVCAPLTFFELHSPPTSNACCWPCCVRAGVTATVFATLPLIRLVVADGGVACFVRASMWGAPLPQLVHFLAPLGSTMEACTSLSYNLLAFTMPSVLPVFSVLAQGQWHSRGEAQLRPTVARTLDRPISLYFDLLAPALVLTFASAWGVVRNH